MNISHVAPEHPARRITSVVVGGINGDTTKNVVLVQAKVFDFHPVKNAHGNHKSRKLKA